MAQSEPTQSDQKRTRKKKPPEQRVAEILKEATPDAVRFLAAAVQDESLSFTQRMDSAKEILNRVFGKSAPGQAEPQSDRVDVVFVLEGNLEEYAG